MIIKASQRSGGQNLAVHLMRTDENEHVDLHELRGFASDNLKEAFREAEAISSGTRCRQYLFSVSFSPPADQAVSSEQFERVIDRAEKLLGLEGQPRAIVIHEKEARRHAHCVWSRIDADTMTARPMSFYKNRLTGLSRELYLEFGWEMPHGLIDSARRDPDNFSLAEWQQAKRLGVDPRWIKQVVRDCWERSDGKAAFEKGLSEHAMFLARGDRRGFVVLDHMGEVHSLSRALDRKQKDLTARLGDPATLRSVSEAKDTLSKLMVPAIKRHIKDSQLAFEKQKTPTDDKRAELVERQRNERAQLIANHTLQFERENRERVARLPTGLRGLWHRITGKYQEVRRQNEAEAEATRLTQNAERHALVERQMDERRGLEIRFKDVRKRQAALLRTLRQDVGRFLAHAHAREHAIARRPTLTSPLKLQR